MKVGLLSLSLYIAALMVQSVSAETVGGDQPGAPIHIAPRVQKSAIDYQSTEDEPYPIDSKDPKLGAHAGNPNEVKGWLKHFDLVVVIDKATQTLNAYKNNAQRPNVEMQTALTAKVSTGQETRDCHFTKQYDAGGLRVTDVKPIYKNTPTGYFVPTAIDADYYSKSYDAANMRDAVRIYPNEGIWNHKYPPGTKNYLGQPASHGCVRMDDVDAQDLFTMVMMTGPQFDVVRDEEFHAHCPQPRGQKAKCVVSAKRDAVFQNYFNKIQQGNYPYSVVNTQHKVGNRLVTTQKVHDLKSQMPRLNAYNENDAPDVILPNRNGYVPTENGVPRTGRSHGKVKFYNTLYIIKDSRNGTDRELNVPAPISCPTVEEANNNLAMGRTLRGDVSVENAQGIQVQNSLPDIGTAFRNFFGGGGGNPRSNTNSNSGGGLFDLFNLGGQQQPQRPPQDLRPRRAGNR